MGQVGQVWAEIGGDASGLKKAAQEGINALEKLRAAASNLGLNNVTDEFLLLNKDALSGFGGIANSAKSASSAVSGLGFSFTELNQAIQLVKQGIRALEDVWDFTSEGAQLVSLSQASTRLAQNYGANMADIVASLKDASMNTLTEYEIMEGANLAMTMGITNNAEEMAQLMQIAIERGRAFGLTTEDAFDRITRGIGRRSTRILDDLGFTANAIQANKEYADSIGISTDALTDDMKVRALFEQILREGNAELANQGGLVADLSTPYQRVSTEFKKLINSAKEGAAFLALPLVASKEEVKSINEQAASYAILNTNYERYIHFKRRAAQGGAYIDESGNLIQPAEGVLTKSQFTQAQSLTAQALAYKGIKAEIEDYNDEQLKRIEAMQLEVGLAGDLAKAYKDYDEAMKKAGKDEDLQKAAIDDLNESYEDFILSTMSNLGVDSKATMSVAYAFGEIDDKSMAAFTAIQQISDEFAKTKDIEKYTRQMENLKDNIANLDGIQVEDKSMTFSIYVRYLVNGSLTNPSSIGAMTSLTNSVANSFGSFISGGGIFGPGGKHGGSFIGMKNGGDMIIPPGSSNDGMPLWVSSGEHVKITPAGNKSVDGGQAVTHKYYGNVTQVFDRNMKVTSILEQLKR